MPPVSYTTKLGFSLCTMRTAAIFLFVCVGVVFAARIRREGEKYETKYDNIDLDEILKSERLLKNYVNCLLDKGKCTPDGSELKRLLPDALETKCSKCSEKQQRGAEKVIKFLLDNKPEVYKDVEAKYDPNGVFRKRYEAEAKEAGIELPPKA